MSIEIRPAKDDEMGQLGLIGAYVYAGAFGDGEDNVITQSNRAEWTLCAFDGPNMVASYSTLPFTMRANGSAMALGGVSTVGTLPEYRRRGLVRKITERSFADMRERGQSVAALWASQAAIYQRYGYATASAMCRYTIDTIDIRLLEEAASDLTVTRVPLAQAFDDIRDIYRTYVADRVGYLHRSKPLWTGNALEDQEASGPVNVAICRDGAGNNVGYLVYTLRAGKVDNEARSQEIVVRDCAWLNIDSLRAMWAFLGKHDLVGRVTWTGVATDDPAPELLAEPRLLHREVGEGYWMRLIDVETALAERGYSADGCVSLGIASDPLAPWNEGTFRLEVSNGEAHVSRTDASPDIELSIKTLCSAFSGYHRVTALHNWGLVSGRPAAVANADALLATRYAPHCPDHF